MRVGSNPTGGIYAGEAHVDVYVLGMDEVVGSNPITSFSRLLLCRSWTHPPEDVAC